MTLKRINSIRWPLTLVAIGAILVCSINTASAATALDTTGFVKSQGQQVVAATFLDSDRNSRKSKSKSKRGASQRTDQRKKEASSKRNTDQRRKAAASKRRDDQRRQAAASKRRDDQRKQAAASKRRDDQRKQAAASKRRDDQRRQAAASKRRDEQRRQAAVSKRRDDQRRQAAASKRRDDQRRQAADSKRRDDQRRQVVESKRRDDQRRRLAETRTRSANTKRAADINRKSSNNSRKTPQRYRPSNSNKPSPGNLSRSPRIIKKGPEKSSTIVPYSSYPRRSQGSSKNNTIYIDRSRLSRTGKLQRNNGASKNAAKVSVWRNRSGNDGSNFDKRNKQRDPSVKHNQKKDRSQPSLQRRRIFDSPGASDIFYDPPGSPIEKVIYDNQYHNYYNDTYYNYNNYYDYSDDYDYGYGHSGRHGWRRWHHECNDYCGCNTRYWRRGSYWRHRSYGHSFGFWFNFNYHSGYRHHYYYPNWSYVDYYYYEPYYPSHYYTTVYYQPVTQITYEPLLPSIDEAWALLADGAFEEALGVFAELVYALPFEAAPRIGYAIASGMLYRNGAAISAMRRAMIDDPQALLDVPIEPLITEHYQWLLEHYSDRVREDKGDIDGLFMVAALRFILEEPTQAYFAIDLAMRRGDEDQSAENLKALISDVIEQGF